MPIYEYQCTNCTHELEIFHKSRDAAQIPACPKCSKDTLDRVISAAGFQLKGSGWYVTDFKDKKKSESVPDDTKSAATSDTPSSKASDSGSVGTSAKPAAESKAKTSTKADP